MLCKRFITIVMVCFLLSGCVASSSKLQQDQATQAEVHYKLGIAYLQANNPTLALKELLLAKGQNPNNASIQVSLAQAYQRKKAYPQAERHYLKGIELSDNDPRYLNNLAALYLDMEQWDKAINYFDKAVADLLFLRPYVAITGKSYAYFQKKKYPEALKYCQEAILIAPRYARAHFLKSEIYQEMGQNDLRRLALEKTVAVAPNYVQALYQLGVLLMQDQELSPAGEKFSQVVELAPESEWGLKSAELLRSLSKP